MALSSMLGDPMNGTIILPNEDTKPPVEPRASTYTKVRVTGAAPSFAVAGALLGFELSPGSKPSPGR